jgi:hypothetical protein
MVMNAVIQSNRENKTLKLLAAPKVDRPIGGGFIE